MAYENLKSAIKQAIKQNGNQEITGNLLQSTLLNIVNTIGAEYKFLGFANSSTVPPTSEEGRLLYFTTGHGDSYVNFPTSASGTYITLEYGIYALTREANSKYWRSDVVVPIAQELGTALDKIMSQKAINTELGKKIDKTSIVQTIGKAEDKVMSQKAINNIRRFMLSTCNLCTYCELKSRDKTDIRPTFIHGGEFNDTIGLSNLLIIPKPSYDLKISGCINSNGYNMVIPAVLFIDKNFNIIDFIFSESETFTINSSDIPTNAIYMCLHQSKTKYLYIEYSAFNNNLSSSLDTGINLESIILLKKLIQNNMTIKQNYGYNADALISQAEITKRSKVPSNLKCYFNLNSQNKPINITLYKLDNDSIGLTNLITIPKIDMTLYGLANLDLYKNVIPRAKSIMFLDNQFNIIGSLYVTESDFDDLNNRIYTLKYNSVPSNAVFMMLYIEAHYTLKIQDSNYLQYTTYDTGINFYEVYYLKKQIEALQNKILTNNKYINKNCVILGDSITNLGGDDCSGEKGWTTYFKNIMNFKSVKSYARSGATWTNTANTKYNITENTGSLSDDNNAYNQINRLINEISKGATVPDYIIIALGTNDIWYRYTTSIKDIDEFETIWNDTTDYSNEVDIRICTSIVKAIRFVYDMIINSKLKNSQVIILTPLQGTFSTVSKINEIGDIIEKCAKICSWNVIRQDYKCGISRLQELKAKTNTSDGTHPSKSGAEIIGKYIASQITSILR